MKKSPYKQSELKEFKTLLKSKISKNNRELKKVSGLLKDQKRYMASLEKGMRRDASQKRNKELLKTMESRLTRKSTRYADAMQRIENKTYGICRKTGNIINKQRLMTLPEATTCIQAKNKK